MNKRLTQEQLQYMEDKVLEWNALFGNDLNNKNLINTYINLCIEEGNEWLSAVELKDKAEELDAICDSIFTGFMLNRLYEGKGYGSWFVVEDLKVPVDLSEFIKCLKTKEIYEYTTLLVISVYKASKDFDVIGAFNRVSESNFSKAISKLAVESGEISLQDCVTEVESAGRYEDVFIHETETHFLIKARKDVQEDKYYPDGKIVKGDSWYKSVETLGGLQEFVYE